MKAEIRSPARSREALRELVCSPLASTIPPSIAFPLISLWDFFRVYKESQHTTASPR